MKKHKPRGPVPSLIGSTNGRPKRVQVLKTSPCSRCNTPLPAGNSCVAIPKLGTGYSTSKRFCDDCYQKILEKTWEDLEEVKAI